MRRNAPRLMQTARGRAFLHVQEEGTMRYKLTMTLMALSLVLRGSADMPMLRWLDDDKARGNLTNVAMKILREDKSLSYAAPTNSLFPANATTDNILVHGDNLEALKALLPFYAGKVKCIYIDPPYNTGNIFENYDDNLEHSTWLSIMLPRLRLMQEFLCDEGSVWIQIDDDEQAYLKVICDEVFGRRNFVNMISVNMKNIAGASGGGEDKRIKKNCEYILVYAKHYDYLHAFKPQYKFTEISELIDQYEREGKSWKYTSVLVEPGEKVYCGSTKDGDGNEIKVYRRVGAIVKSVKQVADEKKTNEKDVYKEFGIRVFETTNAQTSIRSRVMQFRIDEGIADDIISIEYVPRSGKNKGQVYEQYYKGDKCRLFVWLKDTATEIDGEVYKKDLIGTYWDMNAWMKNVAKE